MSTEVYDIGFIGTTRPPEYSFQIGFYLIQHELSRSNPIVAAVKKVILENTTDTLQDTNLVSPNSRKNKE